MPKPKKPTETTSANDALKKFLEQKAEFKRATFWIVGLTPLLVHAWSEKAKREMLGGQTRAQKPGRAQRDPHQEFIDSLYMIEDQKGVEHFGFPVTAVKNAMLSSAHKDKGIPRETVMRSLWMRAPFVRVNTAHPEAICDLPLVRLWGSKPQLREDMVRVGVGLNKKANLGYRAQFTHWAMRIVFDYNASVLNEEAIVRLINDGGMSAGIGDWRNEKKGAFGCFRMARPEEETAWEKFASGKGPLPKIEDNDDGMLQAAE